MLRIPALDIHNAAHVRLLKAEARSRLFARVPWTAWDDIAVFDSSGIALQDLYIGQFLLLRSKLAQNRLRR